MRIALLRAARAAVMAGFAMSAAAFVGLSVYAAVLFGLWWPIRFGITGDLRMPLAALTLLPFLLLFTKLRWRRPLDWLAARFSRVAESIDRAIERRTRAAKARRP